MPVSTTGGLLPKLTLAGFDGPIFTTAAAAGLLGVMLPHSAHIQEANVKRAMRKARRGNGAASGGGPVIMESANFGAFDIVARSAGLSITLPCEQASNPFITPDLAFRFHYFALRKMHFLMRAKALVAFPGGYDTLDELFEVLTPVQTGEMAKLPIGLSGHEFWSWAVDFDYLVAEGMIAPQDRKLFTLMETADQAIAALLDSYLGHPLDAPQDDPKGAT